MGTRNLTMVVSNGETKIGQYGQWDGYPDGQGQTALDFLREASIPDFKTMVDRLEFFTIEDAQALDDSDPNYQWLNRDVAAEILMAVYSGRATKLFNKEAFAKDSLFCEWAYVVDLDKRTFEIYKGFTQSPLLPGERFYGDGKPDDSGYYPVKLVKAYSLDDLPTNERFYADVIPRDEDEE